MVIAPSSRSVVSTGLASTSTGARGLRRSAGPVPFQTGGGSSIRPARCRTRRSPRHTASRGAPFGCVQFHAAHTFSEIARRLAAASLAMIAAMDATSSEVTWRPRCFRTMSTPRNEHGVR